MKYQRYFLKDMALLEELRKEFGMGDMKRQKNYKEYLLQENLKKVKSQALKRLISTPPVEKHGKSKKRTK